MRSKNNLKFKKMQMKNLYLKWLIILSQFLATQISSQFSTLSLENKQKGCLASL